MRAPVPAPIVPDRITETSAGVPDQIAQASARVPTDPAAPILDLGDNTSLYGAPRAALRVLRDSSADDLTSYPSPFADDLRAAIADYIAVAPANVTTGFGSDDVLDSIFRTLAAPGETIAFSEPTFSMIPVLARRNRLAVAAVHFANGGGLDSSALLAARAPLIYVCSPNNPTGTAAARTAIERVLDDAPGHVVLDEAYAEFADDSFAAEAPRRKNLLVARTFSKAFALAGLRIGYAVGDAALIARIEENRGPFKVSTVAERAAVAALRHDREWLREHVAAVRRDRPRLVAALQALGFGPLPTSANFILVPVADAERVAAAMLERGVRVRAFPALPGIGDAVRITVGPTAAIERALAALRQATGGSREATGCA